MLASLERRGYLDLRSAYLVCVFEIEVCLYVVKFLPPGQRLIQSYCLGSFGPGPLHRALFLRAETCFLAVSLPSALS